MNVIDLSNIVRFLNAHDTNQLKSYWQAEIIRHKKFSWRKLIKQTANRRRYFLFWWRLANEMHRFGNAAQQKTARKINSKLKDRYGVELMLGCQIGIGFHMPHPSAIVISDIVVAGKNLVLRQNTTIGKRHGDKGGRIVIGDNVDMGAHCCIISNDITIGDNVTIGAGSMVLASVPDNSTYYMQLNPLIKPKVDRLQPAISEGSR